MELCGLQADPIVRSLCFLPTVSHPTNTQRETWTRIPRNTHEVQSNKFPTRHPQPRPPPNMRPQRSDGESRRSTRDGPRLAPFRSQTLTVHLPPRCALAEFTGAQLLHLRRPSLAAHGKWRRLRIRSSRHLTAAGDVKRERA